MKARFVQAAAILWACISLSACFENNQEAEPDQSVQVRLRNNSGIDFDRVVVTFPQVVEDYGAVASGSASAYHEVSEAHSLAMIDALTMGIRPFTFSRSITPERPLLSAGLYTYTLFMMDDEQLTMSMSRD
jgi:hypothetical protein